MPQMAPMMWLNLFIIFSCSFVVFLAVNYFNKNLKKSKSSTKQFNKISLNWKW